MAWRPFTQADSNNPAVVQNDAGQVWDDSASNVSAWANTPGGSGPLADLLPYFQGSKSDVMAARPGSKLSPDGKTITMGNQFADLGRGGQGNIFSSPLGLMAGGLLGMGAFGLLGEGGALAGGLESVGPMESIGSSVGDFGTNAFEFGGATGTTPLTGGGGFGSSFASSVSDMSNAFTKQFGLSPSNAMSLAQKVSGALGSQGGNGMIAQSQIGAPQQSLFQTGGQSDSLSGAISGGLGIGSGLLDLFSKGPFSSQGILDKAAGTADPLMGDRAGYGGMLKELMTNPDSFMLSPAAKTQMKYGTENLQRSDAAKGLLGSGNILADIMQFGEGVSSQDFWKQIDQLNLLSGAKTGSPPAAGQIMTGNLQGRNNAMSNIGGSLAALSPQVASILKSMGITDPSTYTAGNTSAANGYTYNPGDANMPGDLAMDVPNSAPLSGSFGDAASGSTLEDLFSFA